MVSQGVISAMYMNVFISIFLPIVLLIIFKKKWNVSIKVFLVGMLTFFVFAILLEGLLHSVVVTDKLTKQPFLYMLYGGLSAGIFEEVGRYFMFAVMIKQYRDWKDGLAFGLGHGGFEAVVVAGLNNVLFLSMATMMNSGNMEEMLNTAELVAAFEPIKESLLQANVLETILAGVERISALAIQMGLSILVLYSITSGRKLYLLYAILIHAVIDFPAALFQTGVFTNIYVLEIIILVFAAMSVVWIIQSRKLFTEKSVA